MRIFHLQFLAFIFLLSACKEAAPVKKETPTSATTAEATKPVPPYEAHEPTQDGPLVPGVPKDVMVKLFNECTFIDYIFHELPFSLSQSEDPSIDQNLSYIDFDHPVGHIPADCKAIGRKFFQIKGKIVYDVDIYLSNKCKFYVFVDKNNKPMYANYMTETGVQFYAQIVQQARSSMQSGQGGH